jgi:hypothetical protein
VLPSSPSFFWALPFCGARQTASAPSTPVLRNRVRQAGVCT